MPITFAQATQDRDVLEAEVKASGLVVRAFPHNGPMGLTPDAIKFSPEYQSALLAYNDAFARLRMFNKTYVKQYAKEIRAARRA